MAAQSGFGYLILSYTADLAATNRRMVMEACLAGGPDSCAVDSPGPSDPSFAPRAVRRLWLAVFWSGCPAVRLQHHPNPCPPAIQQVAQRISTFNMLHSSRNGKTLLLNLSCLGHTIHREIEASFRTKVLIPRLYDTAWCVSLPDGFSRFSKALLNIIEADLATGFFPASRPPTDNTDAQVFVGQPPGEQP
jgi:hypothetical protein